MKNWTKLFALILVAAFAVALFAGCQSAPAADPTEAPVVNEGTEGGEEGGEVSEEKDPASFTGTIMTWTADDSWHEVMEPAFNATYPNIVFETTHCAWGDYLQKLTTSLASGLEIPDIICAEVAWRQRTLALELQDNLEEAPYNVDRNDMLEYLIPRCEYDGYIAGLEMQITPGAVSIDRDVAAAVNLDDASVLTALAGENFEGWYTVGEQLVAQDKYLFAAIQDIWIIMSKLMFESRVDENGDINFTGGIEPALKHIYDLFQIGAIGPYEQWTAQWEASRQANEALMYPFTTWSVQGHKDTYDPEGAGSWQLAVLPQGAFSWGGTTMSMYKDGDNKESTWEFVKWGCWSVEGGIAAATTGRSYQIGYAPSYEAPECVSSGIDEYFGVDLFEFWSSCGDNAVATVPTYYDGWIDEATNVAFTALNADPSMTYEAYIDMIKTELENLVAGLCEIK